MTAPQTDPHLIELTREERRLLADKHPALARDRGWLISATAGEHGAVTALLSTLATLGQANARSLQDAELVLRVGGREVAFTLGVTDDDGVMLDGLAASSIAQELDLADRLAADPRSLARLRAASDAAWERLAERWGVLSDYQVAQRAGYTGPRPASYITPFVRQRLLFGVRRRGTRLFPGFEFDSRMRPRRGLRDVIANLPPRWTNLDKALWFDAPNGWLDDQRPAELLKDSPSKVALAAKHAAVPSA